MSKKPKVAYLYQTVHLFKSTLVWYHGKERFPKELDDALEELLKGYKRKIANLKATGEMELREGKGRLLFQGVSVISESLLKKTPKMTIENSKCSKKAGVELKRHHQ